MYASFNGITWSGASEINTGNYGNPTLAFANNTLYDAYTSSTIAGTPYNKFNGTVPESPGLIPLAMENDGGIALGGDGNTLFAAWSQNLRVEYTTEP
jgi:hypothetical protein